jgi:hypothetical protein
MDHRQEARDRFDRIMRVPDRIVDFLGLVLLGTLGLLAIETVSPSQPRNDFLTFFWAVQIGIYALCALYFVTRFVAAFVIARSVRRQRSASARHAVDLHEGNPAGRQTVRRLVAGS